MVTETDTLFDTAVLSDTQLSAGSPTRCRLGQPAVHSRAPEPGGAMTSDPQPTLWLVGATYNGDDQLDRFLAEGIWENGYHDRCLDLVRSTWRGCFALSRACSARLVGPCSTGPAETH